MNDKLTVDEILLRLTENANKEATFLMVLVRCSLPDAIAKFEQVAELGSDLPADPITFHKTQAISHSRAMN